ncbi:alpha/beta hydrolase [Bacillus velezensis]|uniref:alpha/beta fold hydrolase n=1 Tax=Bacillus TaxID=1386 RepID=UPI0009882963|nr:MULTISPECIES: alpha/beta hydrolase [Bacillus]AQS43007.1 alpha/beta hydrolase [Bacillus velezensis]MBT0952608.1 alpha/beta hydrolase [Bacillus velezensis]MCQ9195209.1 alpha/beta hydrolase [Bacillus velezensis]MCX2918043.1 alpha/beta hydrolase [Bacillus velezensis]MCY6276937.1 alpha/beta hydrolase [Bacillus sp. NEAU-16]
MDSFREQFEKHVTHDSIKVNGIRLHYVFTGKEDAPPVILLHGFPQSWVTWRYVIPTLAASHRVIAVDLRGYGDSEKPSGINGYDNKTMAGDIQGLMRRLHIQKALIAGHDRGARVARRLALDAPELAAGLVLIDIMPTEYVYDSLTAAEAAKKYWHWTFQVVPHLPEELIKGKEEEYLRFLLSRGDGLFDLLASDGAWDRYLAAWKQPGAVQAALNDYRAAYQIDLPRYRSEKESQKKLDVPTLLLWGEKGNLAGLPVLDTWRESIREVSGYEVKGCGHYVPEEKPTEAARRIIDFSKTVF